MQTHDHILLAIVRAEDLDVAVRESCVAEPLRHCFRSGRYATNRVRGVDLYELLEDVVRQFAGGVVVHLSESGSCKEKEN